MKLSCPLRSVSFSHVGLFSIYSSLFPSLASLPYCLSVSELERSFPCIC